MSPYNIESGRFEWHLTYDRHHGPVVQEVCRELNFSYSEIAGCPLLGQSTYAYVTGFDKDSTRAAQDLKTARNALSARGIHPIRCKIEDVVYDSKTSINRLGHHVIV